MSDEYDWDTNPEGLIDWTSTHKSNNLLDKIISIDLSEKLSDDVKAKINLLHGNVIVVEAEKLKRLIEREYNG